MKKLLSHLVCLGIVLLGFNACNEEQAAVVDDTTVSAAVLAQIKKLGFHTHDVLREEGGYIVEGDIFLSEQDVQEAYFAEALLLRIAETEQYRTTNLVTGLPRLITVTISSRLPSSYVAALDEALNRFNSENLSLTFQRVSSNGDISITRGNGNYLASAGFPSSSGDPYGSVLINSRFLGNNPNQSYLATIIAHEIGHCIGFRHTDYMDRSFSCGGAATNEGASTVGAILIPGTPSGPDAGSWMLACIGSGQNRPFNTNDRTALSYLY
jgi:hypothetical protein